MRKLIALIAAIAAEAFAALIYATGLPVIIGPWTFNPAVLIPLGLALYFARDLGT